MSSSSKPSDTTNAESSCSKSTSRQCYVEDHSALKPHAPLEEAPNTPCSVYLSTALCEGVSSLLVFAVVNSSMAILATNLLGQPIRTQPLFPAPVITIVVGILSSIFAGAIMGGTHTVLANATERYIAQFTGRLSFSPRFTSEDNEYREPSLLRDIFNVDFICMICFGLFGVLRALLFSRTGVSSIIRLAFTAGLGSFFASLVSSILRIKQNKRYHMERSYPGERELRLSWIKLLAEEINAIAEETDYEIWLISFPAKVVAGIMARISAVVSGAGMTKALCERSGLSTLGVACVATMVKSMCFDFGWFFTMRVVKGFLRRRRKMIGNVASRNDICKAIDV